MARTYNHGRAQGHSVAVGTDGRGSAGNGGGFAGGFNLSRKIEIATKNEVEKKSH